MASVGLARAVWIPSAAALIGSIGYFATQPYKLEKPQPMLRYVAGDKAFAVKHPGNWKAVRTGSHGILDAIAFEPSNQVAFKMEMDLQSSLFADMSRASDNQQESLEGALADMSRQNPELAKQIGALGQGAEKKKSPVEKLHEMNAAGLDKEYKDYKEGAPIKTTLGGREAVESEFTSSGDGLWGPKPVAGKRITSLTGEKGVSVIYYGPQDQMTTLKPIFQEMVASIQFGVETGGAR